MIIGLKDEFNNFIVEKEAKEKQKKESLKSSREKKLIEFRKVWVDDVLPNWEKKYVPPIIFPIPSRIITSKELIKVTLA